MYKAYRSKIFDNTIMFLIGLSSMKLAADTYIMNNDKTDMIVVVSDNVDTFLNVCFLFECITKIIAMGFGMDEGSYVRESWN